MLRKLCLILCCLVAMTAPAHAGWFTSDLKDDLQKALTARTIRMEGYQLSRDELEAFYAARHFQPAWDFTGGDTDQQLANFLESIENLIAYHGLQREDYPLDILKKLSDADTSDEVRLKLDFLVTDTLLQLAHDLHGDQIELNHLYVGWQFQRDPVDIPAELARAVGNNSLNDLLEKMTPRNPAYRQLAKALRVYRGLAARGGWSKIEAGQPLKPGDRGTRVAALRARLAAENYLPAESLPEDEMNLFDEDLKRALTEYQIRNGLEADGQLGKKTQDTLNIPIEKRIDQIRANMERWRHMPNDFPSLSYVMVNIPAATIEISQDGKINYSGPVIVGQVSRKTPFIQSTIKSMIINPVWHVPRKIARKDILPKLREDPTYLERLGFAIRGNEDDPYGDSIDWNDIEESDFNYELRQAPGAANSLGRIKFDFLNDFAVYLHGTPHQELFDKNERALSSGCIRLRDPEKVAEILMTGSKETWDVERVNATIAERSTRRVALTRPIPVNIVYWTVFIGDAGQVNFRNDIYGYDRLLIDSMKPLLAMSPQPTENIENNVDSVQP